MNNESIAELTLRLQKALDSNYDVIDLGTVLYVICELEGATITKEQLETTRLAKYINQLRRRTWSDQLARRAKTLLKKWREMVIPTIASQPTTLQQPQQQQNQQQISQIQQKTSSLQSSSQSHLHVSVSQPTSPVQSHETNKKYNAPRHSGQVRNSDNSSLPEYPSSSSSSMKNLSRKYQQSSLSNGAGYRGSKIEDQVTGSQPGKISGDTKSIQNLQAKKQPISFTNLIDRHLHSQLQTGSRCSSTGVYLVDDNRSQSPKTLPRIPKICRDRQSPMIIEHSVSPLEPDQSSNPSRENSLAPPPSIVGGTASLAAINNNNTISSCSRLINGDHTAPSIDLHDLNSNSNLPINLDPIIGAQHHTENRSSEHRKSKKHKKDKKRSKHEKNQDAIAASNKLQPPFTTDPVLNDEANICGTFPMQENLSLSNSSLSIFPGSSTNVTTMNTTNRSTVTTIQNPETELTFAGKFKSTSSSSAGNNLNTTSGATIADASNDSIVVRDIPASAGNTLGTTSADNTGFSAVIGATKLFQKHKESDTIIIESRSCSPFTPIGAPFQDSSSSSSTTNQDLIDVASQDSRSRGQDENFTTNQSKSIVQPQQQPVVLQAPARTEEPLKPSSIETESTKTPKKRGRKKGSKGADAMLAQLSNQLDSKLLTLPSLSGSKKVKTTKELLADIQNRRLGSATSSPTRHSQSRPPSTCSEPSSQSPSTSDACSTNATVSTVARSTPDQHISTNPPQVGEESGSSSSSPPDGKKLIGTETQLVTRIENGTAQQQDTNSVEEYIKNLASQLPPMSSVKIEWDMFKEEYICTCTLREVEQVKVELIDKNNDEESSSSPTDHPPGAWTNINKSPSVMESDNNFLLPAPTLPAPPPPPPPSQQIKVKPPSSPSSAKAIKKPVKSIFDLDYDEENDPLHTFVEAAKTAGDNSGTTTVVDSKKKIKNDIPNNEADETTSELAGKQQVVIKSNSSVAAATESVIISVETPPQQQIPPLFPQFEIVEDADCIAKQRYDIQPNHITKFHINMLHNCYIPNVNGNWDDSEPKNIDDDCNNCLSNIDTIVTDGLYERVVPQYSHMIMDRIPKDLSHVQFSKNYKNKTFRLKIKRKRSSSSSTLSDDTTNTKGRQRQKKRTKTKDDDDDLPEVDCDKKDEILLSINADNIVDDNGRRNEIDNNNLVSNMDTASVCIDDSVDKIVVVTIDDYEDDNGMIKSEPIKYFDDDDDVGNDDDDNDNDAADQVDNSDNNNKNIIELNTEQEDTMAVSGSRNNDNIIILPPFKAVNSTDSNQSSRRSSSSCSNSSFNANNISCNNSSNNNIINDNDNENKNKNDYDNDDDDDAASIEHNTNNTDDDDNIDDDDYDYDNDDFHDIVTHDMTSSISTTSQKHIVLTIKKTPSKTTPQSSPSSISSSFGNINDINIKKRKQLKLDNSCSTIIDNQKLNNNIDDDDIDGNNDEINDNDDNDGVSNKNIDTNLINDNENDVMAVEIDTTVISFNVNDNHNKFTTDTDNSGNAININQTTKITPINIITSINQTITPTTSINDTTPITTTTTTQIPTTIISKLNSNDNDDDGNKTKFLSANCIINDKETANINNNNSENIKIDNDNNINNKNISSSPKYNIGTDSSVPDDNANNDDDDDDNDDYKEDNDDDDDKNNSLPDDNNSLLLSFNNLTDENRTGIRRNITNGQIQQFKEWHEVLQVRSYNDELLTILPYVVID